MKKILLVNSLLALSSLAFAQDWRVVVEFDVNYYASNNGAVCKRDEMKAINGGLKGDSMDSLISKLERQTDTLRSLAEREKIRLQSGRVDYKYPVVVERVQAFETKVDRIKDLHSRLEREQREYYGEIQSEKSAREEDARLDEAYHEQRIKVEILERTVGEKLSDLSSLIEGINSSNVLTPEMRVFQNSLVVQVDERKKTELQELTRERNKERELKEISEAYVPPVATYNEVREAYRALMTGYKTSIDEYSLLKRIVDDNQRLANELNPLPHAPKNSYEDEMQCATALFKELGDRFNVITIP